MLIFFFELESYVKDRVNATEHTTSSFAFLWLWHHALAVSGFSGLGCLHQRNPSPPTCKHLLFLALVVHRLSQSPVPAAFQSPSPVPVASTGACHLHRARHPLPPPPPPKPLLGPPGMKLPSALQEMCCFFDVFSMTKVHYVITLSSL